MQPCWARTYRLGVPRAPKRPGGYLLVGAGGDPFGTQGAEATLSSALQVCGFAVEVRERFIGLDAPGDVDRVPEMLEGRAPSAKRSPHGCLRPPERTRRRPLVENRSPCGRGVRPASDVPL